ncbi:ras family protein [Capsaspora owczarzaki ATCC 30864]|uniref:Ras family protein n=1 Tax=Capsaspora owczarzaki (strain ATCC 30864) TaxID=595528 RepID=A0A0D2UQL8_CAPO3|nr:ras family protein [Capsaspora owczarzaki ATCC 30864]KJE97311.1 ras family protein [Capsaspora owczarzaki ATCC 30864]|eukprot:XP_004343614.1 ras family protein [Capsaspora owczarzaki ATCC 30864]
MPADASLLGSSSPSLRASTSSIATALHSPVSPVGSVPSNLLHTQAIAQFKVILVGDASAGKTSLLHRFIHGFMPEHTVATIGVDFDAREVFHPRTGQFVRIHLWDTAGQERYRTVTTSYYRADGCLLVYDLTSPKALASVRYWLDEVAEWAPSSIVTRVVGNKADLEDKLTQEQVGNIQAIETLATCQGATASRMSVAQNADAVDELFVNLIDAMLDQATASTAILATSPSSQRDIRSPSFSLHGRRDSLGAHSVASTLLESSSSASFSPPSGRRSPFQSLLALRKPSDSPGSASSTTTTSSSLSNPSMGSIESFVARSPSPTSARTEAARRKRKQAANLEFIEVRKSSRCCVIS